MNRLFFLFILLAAPGFIYAQECDCPDADSDRDTSRLIDFFEAMGGESWENKENWGNTDSLARSWYGVLVDTIATDCITCLDLDGQLQIGGEFSTCGACLVMDDAPPGNNLSITTRWPNNFALPCLKKLSLDNNKLGIPLPDVDFSGFTALCELYLRDNLLSGELSSQGFNNPELRIINLNDNELTGGIPANLKENDVLRSLDQLLLNNNDLTGPIPILTGLSSYAVGRNRLTFEDIVPVAEALGDAFVYSEQQPVFRIIDTTIALGLPFSIALDFDLEIADNVYQWHQNGVPAPGQTANTLRFDSVTTQHAGIWTVSIRNPRATQDTLESFPITIDVCPPGIWEVVTEVCPGQDTMIEGITFREDSVYYLPDSAQNGCDSVWKVDLVRLAPVLTLLDTFVCVNEPLFFDGFPYEAGVHDIIMMNDRCTMFSDTLRLNVLEATEEALGAAEITDSLSCGPAFQPGGNLPPGTFGRWELFEEAFTIDLTDPNAIITDLTPGENTIRWTLGAGSCPAYSSVAKTIIQEQVLDLFVDTLPTLFDDQSSPLDANPFDVLNNDAGWRNLMDSFDLIISSPPSLGSARIDENNQLVYRRSLGSGTDTLAYGILRGQCPVEETSVFVNIEPKFLGADQLPPNVITPDGDGYNDVLKIPLLEYNQGAFPQSKLSVYWKQDFLFDIDDYQNDWNGLLPDGSRLPAGNFYRYIIEYGDERFRPHSIDLTIIYQQ